MATTTRVLTASVNGTVYTTNANGALEAIDTCHSGATAPTDEVANGKFWLDTTTTPGILKMYDNATWNVVVNATNVTAAGALMDSELTAIASVKALDQGVATTDSPSFVGLTATGAFTSLGIDDNATSTAITIDASENVGIGTASPSSLMHVHGVSPFVTIKDSRNKTWVPAESLGGINFDSADVSNSITTQAKIEVVTDNTSSGTYAAMAFSTSTPSALTEACRIDSSGNFGIGTAAPTLPLHVYSGSIATLASFESAGATSRIIIKDGTATHGSYLMDVGDALAIATNAVERLRIDASGNVLVGKTADDATVAGMSLRANGVGVFTRASSEALYANRLTTDGAVVKFARQTTTVGSISVTASATAYNTTSDYRLKENITPIQGAADIVMTMQPCTYTAIADGLWYDGFLAHELQEVHPRAVQGTKDAMKDEEYEITPATETEEAVMGTRSVPDMQSVDYSKITPILTAALQEALTEIAALKVRVAALEV